MYEQAYSQLFILIGLVLYYFLRTKSEIVIPGLKFDPKSRKVTIKRLDNDAGSLTGMWGKEFPFGKRHSCDNEEGMCVEWTDIAKLNITYHESTEARCYNIVWTSLGDDAPYDCFNFNDSWFGGGEVYSDRWPINKLSTDMVPFVSYDVGLARKNFGSVLESLWFSSSGFALYVDHEVPLHVSVNDNSLCIKSKYDPPFRNPEELPPILKYTLCSTPNVKTAYTHLAKTFLKPPQGIPDEDMFTAPIWSTWVQFKTSVDQEKVMKFSKDILAHGFETPQRMEIDDIYTPAYGDYIFDPNKFPSPSTMIAELHKLKFNVTSWVMPFCETKAKAFYIGAKHEYFVLEHNSTGPGMVVWWNGIAAAVDYTNPDATEWYFNRLSQLTQLGMDSFKFDAGETQYLPAQYRLHSDPFSPLDYSTKYVEAAYKHTNNKLEVRVGYETQHLPIFVRMMDKDSLWHGERGLDTVIPTALLFGILGYPFVLPDMIGGNAYDESGIGAGDMPERELFIRWLQVNTFLPSMQFSIAPWQYDDEVVQLTHQMLQIRKTYVTDRLLSLAKESTKTGYPIIRALWWTEPDNPDLYTIDTQFLVGDDLMVAPVLERNARSRDVVIPTGRWMEMNTRQVYDGRLQPEVRALPADINTVPYFIRQAE